MTFEDRILRRRFSRRSALKAGAAGMLASQATLFSRLAMMPVRPVLAAATPSDIQFDIGAFVAAPVTVNDGAGNVVAGLDPVFNVFLPAKLNRTPSKFDQQTLANAFATIEANYPFSPQGAFVFASYGLPYFNRLPASVVAANMPRLLSDTSRFVLEEAVPSPTDVVNGFVGGVQGVTKERFNVNVRIEQNDVLFQLRGDSLDNLNNIVEWLEGETNVLNGNFVPPPDFDFLFTFQPTRLNFVQIGLPRKVADNAAQKNAAAYEYHTRINSDSPMAMGFLDQQVNASATPQAVIFVGSSHGVLTTAMAGDYFDNGAICHFSHDIEDLFQFYETPQQDPAGEGEPFTERVQYMFRSNQLGTTDGLPSDGNADQFSNGGGPAYINNVFQGTNDAFLAAQDAGGVFSASNAIQSATFQGQHRIGHISALQRSGRAADGTPLHLRNDGPGFTGLDVPQFQDFPGTSNAVTFPAGTPQFSLEFLVFVPSAEFFRQMRANQAAQDLQQQFGVNADDNGLERFITATRRQNFLTPPRRHRAFPLVELT